MNIKSPAQQQIEGHWKQFTGKVKETWGDLTNDDLDRFEGKMDQLEGHIEEKTGEDRAAIRRKIDALARTIKQHV